MKSELTIDRDGNKHWKLPNGKSHREKEPAFELSNGTRCWYINGKLHREDGPAIEYGDGDKEWYLNGTNYAEKKTQACNKRKKA